MSIFGLAALAALPLDSRISVALTAPWTASDPAVEAAELIRQAHSHDTLLQFWHAFAKSSSVLEAVEAAAPLAASARRAARRACRGAARRHVGAARGIAPASHAVDESAPCWYVACGAPVASAGAAMSKLRDGEVLAAHGTGPGCAAADAAWGQRLAEADHFVSQYEVGLDERGQPPAGTSVAFAYCDPRAPGFAQELESMLFRGAPARHTLAVALRYRPASRLADDPLHLQGFGAKLALKSSEYSTHDKSAERGDGDDDADEEAADDDDSAKPSWLLRKRAHEPVSALSAERIADLGLQATLLIVRSKRPLATLRDAAQNLPALARTLAATSLATAEAEALRKEVDALAMPLSALGAGAATINGLPLPLHTPDALFASVRVPYAAASARRRCARSGSRPSCAAPASGAAAAAAAARRARAPPDAVVWLADVEKDKPFAEWAADAAATARARSARRTSRRRASRHNALTALVVADPADAAAAPLISHALLLAKRHAPSDWVVPHGRSGAALRLVYHANATGGRALLTGFLRRAAAAAAAQPGRLSAANLSKAFEEAVGASGGKKKKGGKKKGRRRRPGDQSAGARAPRRRQR